LFRSFFVPQRSISLQRCPQRPVRYCSND